MTLFHPFLIVWSVILSRYEGCKSYLIYSTLLILIKLKTSYVLFKADKTFGLMHATMLCNSIVAVFVVHTCPRAIPLAMITMRKWVSFLSYMSMGLLLVAIQAAGGPLQSMLLEISTWDELRQRCTQQPCVEMFLLEAEREMFFHC